MAISEITVQIHRGKIMQQMCAAWLAELVRIAGALEIPRPMLEACTKMIGTFFNEHTKYSQRRHPEMAAFGKYVIAVVDDDNRVLKSLGVLLESAGYAGAPIFFCRKLLRRSTLVWRIGLSYFRHRHAWHGWL